MTQATVPPVATNANGNGNKSNGNGNSHGNNIHDHDNYSTTTYGSKVTWFQERWHGFVVLMREIFNVRIRHRIKRSNSFYEKFNRVAAEQADEDIPKNKFLKIFSLKFWKTVVFNRSGDVYYFWLMAVSIAAIYNLAIIVARSVFVQLNLAVLPLWLTLDYLCDAVYLVDIFFSMRIGFLEHGQLVCNTRVLLFRYLKSWRFVVDVIACLPTDAFYPLCPLGLEQTEVRFNRILKSYKILEFKELTEMRTSRPLLAKIISLIVIVTLILHWNACLYFLFSDLIGFGSDIFVYPPVQYLELTSSSSHESESEGHSTESESSHDDHETSTESTLLLTELTSAVVQLTTELVTEHVQVYLTSEDQSVAAEESNSTDSANETTIDPIWNTLTRQYVYSLYWATLTQTIIADNPLPQTVGEAVFMIVNYTVAVIVFDVIIVTVGSVIRSSNAENEKFQSMMDGVKRYMRFRVVNARLRKRVLKWFDYLYAHPRSEDSVLDTLPDNLRVEIAMSIHYDTLKRVSIFEDCEFSLLMELVTKLKQETFGPGDYVCRKGDIGKEMYIVKRGKLEVVSPDGKLVFVTLNEGSVFGELCVLNIPGNRTEGRRSASVRSFGYSDLFVLNKDDLWEALTEFPEAKSKLVERGAAILRKDKLLDEQVFEASTRSQLTPLQQLTNMHQSVDDASSKLVSLIARFNKLQDDLEKRLSGLEGNSKAPKKDDEDEHQDEKKPAQLLKIGTNQIVTRPFSLNVPVLRQNLS